MQITGPFLPSRFAAVAVLLVLPFPPTRAEQLTLPPETSAIIEKVYSFDLEGAQEAARQMQKEHPDDPLGYLLESDALWWRFWCTAAEFKYGMSDARRRAKLPDDQHYLELAATASSLASAELKQQESAEMQLYAGMADAAAARLYALRGENRNTARSGVRARDHFLRAKTLDPIWPTPILASAFTTITWTRSAPSPESYASSWASPGARNRRAFACLSRPLPTAFSPPTLPAFIWP